MAHIAQAACYGLTTDMYGQSTDGVDKEIDNLCAHDLAGYFTEGQTKYHCVQLPKNKVEIWVGWNGSGGLTLNSEDCTTRLKNELNGCVVGGESAVADWHFR